MKNVIFCAMLVIISFINVAVAAPSERLWKAIIKVESNGNPNAIGDKGKAVGIAQMHIGVVIDCNRIVGYKKFTVADRRNPAKCRQMFEIYLNFYVPRGTDQQLARCWNGGKGNINRACTLGYWRKVQKAMK